MIQDLDRKKKRRRRCLWEDETAIEEEQNPINLKPQKIEGRRQKKEAKETEEEERKKMKWMNDGWMW